MNNFVATTYELIAGLLSNSAKLVREDPKTFWFLGLGAFTKGVVLVLVIQYFI